MGGAAAGATARGAKSLGQKLGVPDFAARKQTRATSQATGIAEDAIPVLQETLRGDRAGSAERLATAGKGAMMADMGPNARALLDTAIQKSGPAGVAARKQIDNRVTVAAKKVDNALNDAFGVRQGTATVERGIRAGKKTPSEIANPGRQMVAEGHKFDPPTKAAYDLAYEKPIDYSTRMGVQIEEIIKDRVPPSAIKAANKLMRMEGSKSKQIKATILDDGSIKYETLPDVRQVDYITRGLNQIADREAGKGALGGTTQLGRSYGNLSRQLRTLTKDSVPEYAQALKLAADPIQARKALQTGRDALSAKMPRDELVEAMRGMSEMERSFLAQGVREVIDDSVANVKKAFTDTNMDAREAAKALKDLSSRSSRDKITTAIGKDKAGKLFAELDEATVAFELKASVAQNSKTFARESLASHVTELTEAGPMNALRRGEPVQAAKEGLRGLLGGSRAQRGARQDQIYSDLVNALTQSADPRMIQGLLNPVPMAPGMGARAKALLPNIPAGTSPLGLSAIESITRGAELIYWSMNTT